MSSISSADRFNKAADMFNTFGGIPVLSTINAVLIRFPMGLVALVAKVATAIVGNKELSATWTKIAKFNFIALFGELIPGLNILFHKRASNSDTFGHNTGKFPSTHFTTVK